MCWQFAKTLYKAWTHFYDIKALHWMMTTRFTTISDFLEICQRPFRKEPLKKKRSYFSGQVRLASNAIWLHRGWKVNSSLFTNTVNVIIVQRLWWCCFCCHSCYCYHHHNVRNVSTLVHTKSIFIFTQTLTPIDEQDVSKSGNGTTTWHHCVPRHSSLRFYSASFAHQHCTL